MRRALVVLVLLTAYPSIGLAQVEPTEEQLNLDVHAFEAMAAGEHETAIADYRSSLEIQELNVVWLNLGRAYQKAGQCAEAWDAFSRVDAAPVVADPPSDVVLETRDTYRAELMEECPTRVSTRCEFEAQIEIDGVPRGPCGNVFDVAPGQHLIVAEWEGGSIQHEKEVSAGLVLMVNFGSLPQSEQTPDAGDDPPRSITPPDVEVEESEDTTPDWGGYGLVVAGTAIAVGALALDGVLIEGFPATASNYELDAVDVLPVFGYALAVGALVWGLARVLP